MAVVTIMDWAGVTPEQYERARSRVNWEGNIPAGAQYHVSAFDERGLRVVDIWDSAEAFQKFADERLTPATRELGIAGEPKVQILPVHAIFAPAYERAGASRR